MGIDLKQSLERTMEFARKAKISAVECMTRGDIPPQVIVERDGKVLAIVSADEVDKNKGLHIASVCQIGFDPDVISMVFDAHMAQGQKAKEGQTMEEVAEEFRQKYPPGSMQKMCDEEGACERGEIIDCLICHVIDREGRIMMATLPYAYHGKDGPPFRWVEEARIVQSEIEEEGKRATMTGTIPDVLRGIMKQPSKIDELFNDKEMKEKFQEFRDFSQERIRFHISRVIMGMLAAEGFMVLDQVTGEHPEWTDCLEKAANLLDFMIKEGALPEEARKPVQKVIDDHLGKKTFNGELLALLTKKHYWLPQKYRNDLPNFVSQFESTCMTVQPPLKKPDIPKDAKRVNVWNGDRSEFLGEGSYVGEVTVWFVETEEGLQSFGNAEEKPDESLIPEGGVLRSSENNPKIILDDGQVIYGCQCWWEPITNTQRYESN